MSEELADKCSTNGRTIFNYAYRCRSCVPGYSLNPLNSTMSHNYNNTAMVGNLVSFTGDCLDVNMTSHQLDPNYAEYTEAGYFSQVLMCDNSNFTYSFLVNSQSIVYSTEISCGNCAKFMVSKKMVNNCQTLGINQATYKHLCVECKSGYALTSQSVLVQNTLYGNTTIDLTAYCVSVTTNNNTEFRSNSANWLANAILMLSAIFAVLN